MMRKITSIGSRNYAHLRISIRFQITFLHTTKILSLFRRKVTKNFLYGFLKTYPNFSKFLQSFIQFS